MWLYFMSAYFNKCWITSVLDGNEAKILFEEEGQNDTLYEDDIDDDEDFYYAKTYL